MYAEGVRQALAAGAAVVIPKSANETEAGKRQLDSTDYALLDSAWRPIAVELRAAAGRQPAVPVRIGATVFRRNGSRC